MTLLAPLTNSLDPKFFTAYVFSRFILENAKKSFLEKYQVRPVLRSALDMTSLNLISHVLETRKFVTAILHSKQGLLCDKYFFVYILM